MEKMELSPQQQIELLQEEIKLQEFGKRWYGMNPFYVDQVRRTLQMHRYDTIIQNKNNQIKKLNKLLANELQ